MEIPRWLTDLSVVFLAALGALLVASGVLAVLVGRFRTFLLERLGGSVYAAITRRVHREDQQAEDRRQRRERIRAAMDRLTAGVINGLAYPATAEHERDVHTALEILQQEVPLIDGDVHAILSALDRAREAYAGGGHWNSSNEFVQRLLGPISRTVRKEM